MREERVRRTLSGPKSVFYRRALYGRAESQAKACAYEFTDKFLGKNAYPSGSRPLPFLLE